MCTFISHSTASVNARAAKAPAVGLSCLSGGENSRGKRRRLESPPEQAKPAEDPKAASPGQRRSQGPPHDTNGFLGPSLSTTGGSSPSCSLGYEGAPVPQGYLGRKPSHIGDQAGPSGCSRFLRRTPPHQAVSELDEASHATLQEELSPTLSCRELAATDTRVSAGLSPTFTLLPGMDTKMRLRERFDCPLGKSFKPAGSAAMMRLLEQPLVREEDIIFTKMPTEDGHGETGVTFGHYF
ncbi:hypothetical protein MRX96_041702 [Rhipicephalus microplus]